MRNRLCRNISVQCSAASVLLLQSLANEEKHREVSISPRLIFDRSRVDPIFRRGLECGGESESTGLMN
jgi:hypothetical protein